MSGHAAILGWAGSTARQLRTIAAWYEGRSLTPIVVTPRVFRAMAFPWGWSREGAALARRVEGARGPLVVHAFSNAGFWTYAAMVRALVERRNEVLDRVSALVLDSAPGFPARLDARFTSRYSAMAMMPIVLRALGRPPALSHPLLDPPLRAFMRLWYHVSPLQIRFAERSLDVVRETGRWPILALYSSADTLVSAEHVEAFLAAIRDRPLRAIRWEDSEHVRHMIVHRREYFAAVSELLDAVSAQRAR